MKFKLKQWAQIAEVISAVAIVLSLIFVGLQLRSNAQATQYASANATNASISSWYSRIANNEQASSIFWSALSSPDSLTPAEWYQFVLNMHALMLNLQNSYYLNAEGTLDTEIQNSLAVIVAGVRDQPGFARYWEQRKSIFYPEFQAYIDAIMDSEVQVSEGLYEDIIPNSNDQD
ncbi:hypothetical protein [Sphingomicrobium marinum]|uniref:hypothetical protein n=1 Tax=Sphingomicrobium marinum TaxID=1227950 RepID=UPI00223EBF9C|nr:hypothetical protein [Sphingomicrobium marinum]